MELKRKQEEEDRKKREEEEKVMQVWTTLKCNIFPSAVVLSCCKVLQEFKKMTPKKAVFTV